MHGITIAMEEQRALDKNIPDEAITGIKTGLKGPFAGIGDIINWATITTPIVAAFFVPFAKEGAG
ncbi:MAG: mannose system component [Thermoanaerobacteraceae bacterium]|nr:mannose system component [Thermoanaerobacteraceae bacterium]